MEMEEFSKYKKVEDLKYPYINKYEITNEVYFFVEPNFYTQLMYAKDHFLDHFNEILDVIEKTTLRNKKVIFTADFENPVVYLDDYIYREIGDVLAELKLSFDNKGNPESEWKD